jgi:hypothetical protein
MFSTLSALNSNINFTLKPFTTIPQGNLYTYTGNNQVITVPIGKKYMTVFLWGAGGGCSGIGAIGTTSTAYSGGGGGYTSATFNVNPGEVYTLIVGQGGGYNTPGASLGTTYGGGGGALGNGDNNWRNAQGGGRSAVQINGNDIITTGGGGGGGINYLSGSGISTGGAGGGLIGGNALTLSTSIPIPYGTGGTQTTGGIGGYSQIASRYDTTNGNQYLGGNGGSIGSGGGGGYFGGGGGSAGFPQYYFCGGGGGSSYVNKILCPPLSAQVITRANGNIVANNTQLPLSFIGTIGNGGVGPITGTSSKIGNSGQNGLILIYFTPI